MILTKNYLERLELNKILNLAEFVVNENFKHHLSNIFPEDYKKDVHTIYKEEVNYFKDSEVYVAKDYTGEILGSIRVLKWNYIDSLPLQKIFEINPLLVTKNINVNSIYHIGRFAIKKEIRDVNLFKQLMICAITPICKHKENIAFAECDSKLLRILSLLGIKTTVIGKSINYLGSETIPICMTYDGLIHFYNKNKEFVSSTALKSSAQKNLLHESVILNKQRHNYPLV